MPSSTGPVHTCVFLRYTELYRFRQLKHGWQCTTVYNYIGGEQILRESDPGIEGAVRHI